MKGDMDQEKPEEKPISKVSRREKVPKWTRKEAVREEGREPQAYYLRRGHKQPLRNLNAPNFLVFMSLCDAVHVNVGCT
jgi:hypothetical protein